MRNHLRASCRRISSVACQNGNTVGMQTCSSGECAPLRRSNAVSQHQNGGLPLAIAYRSTAPPACRHLRDSGPVADAVQAGQLLPDDAALQTCMDGLHLGLLACTPQRGGIQTLCAAGSGGGRGSRGSGGQRRQLAAALGGGRSSCGSRGQQRQVTAGAVASWRSQRCSEVALTHQ